MMSFQKIMLMKTMKVMVLKKKRMRTMMHKCPLAFVI